MSPHQRQWIGDVVVIGAGPAGCATATILARHGARTALVDDGRCTSWPGETLPSGSTPVVEDIFGAGVLHSHQRAFAVQAAWETEELQITDSIANPLGEGWLLDRRVFGRQTRASAARSGARPILGHGQVRRDAGAGWQVRLPDQLLRAPLLVDATGRPASIARRNGAGREAGSRLLACIVALSDSGDSVQATTIESVPEGWWYSTPTPTGGRVLALVSHSALVPRGNARSAWWVASLARTRHIRGLLHGSVAINADLASDMFVSPAGTGWLDRPSGTGWVAVGDAAAHFDPLSSQGLLTGILMGARAALAIINDSLADWCIDYRMLVEDHQKLAAHYYSLVKRWPNSTFWLDRAPTTKGV